MLKYLQVEGRRAQKVKLEAVACCHPLELEYGVYFAELCTNSLHSQLMWVVWLESMKEQKRDARAPSKFMSSNLLTVQWDQEKKPVDYMQYIYVHQIIREAHVSSAEDSSKWRLEH